MSQTLDERATYWKKRMIDRVTSLNREIELAKNFVQENMIHIGSSPVTTEPQFTKMSASIIMLVTIISKANAAGTTPEKPNVVEEEYDGKISK